MLAPFNNCMPCVKGKKVAIFCRKGGNNSKGIVVPQSNNIGK